MKKYTVSALIGMALFGASLTAANATPYPERPVTMVVSFAPGGMTDIVTRLLAGKLTEQFGRAFVVENKPGAAGQVGTEWVARQKNDGYTLLVSATGHVIGPAVNPKVKYDPVGDFEPIAVLARAPNLVIVNEHVPATTIPEFLAWAKEQPSIPYGSAGFGGSTHLGGEWMKKLTDLKLEHVPYKGAAPATTAVMSGELQVGVQDSMTVATYSKTGQIRPIGVASAERSQLFPDLPTFHEMGVEGLDVYTWLGLYAPAGTDAEIVQKLNAAVYEIMHSDDMVQRLKNQSSEPTPALTPTEVRDFVAAENLKWTEVVKSTGVVVE